MYGKYVILCLYCGAENEKNGYFNTSSKEQCPSCKETKLLKILPEKKKEDIYGYRFSPPFPEKSKQNEEQKEYKDTFYTYFD